MTLYIGNMKVTPSTHTSSGGQAVINPLEITPTTSQQNISATGGVNGFSPITVNAVTSSIDSNITAGNIKSGVSILGVTGNYVTPTNVNLKLNFENPVSLPNNSNFLVHNDRLQMYTTDTDVLNPLSLENNIVDQFIHDGKYELNTSDNTISSTAQEGSAVAVNLYESDIVVLMEITYTTNCGFSGILTGTNWSLDWGTGPVWSKPYATSTTTYIVAFYLINGQNTFGVQFGQTDSSIAGTVKISKIHKFKIPTA